MSKAAKNSILVLIIIFIIINFYIIIKSIINPNKIPDFFGYKMSVINNEVQNLKKYDLAIIKNNDNSKIALKKIVVYRKDNKMYTNEIMAISKEENGYNYYIKKENGSYDKVTQEEIEGIVSFAIPIIGLLWLILGNKYVMFVALMVVLIVFYLKNFKIKNAVNRNRNIKI